jgi:hypothetical protein
MGSTLSSKNWGELSEVAAFFKEEVLCETVNKDESRQNISTESHAAGSDARASSRARGLRPTRS